MAKYSEKEDAIAFRKEGKSYSQIKQILHVSKSSLSLWLRDYPLPKWRLRELRDYNEQRIEKFRFTMKNKKEERLLEIYKNQRKILLPLSKRDLLIAGIFLYWGEGEKSKSGRIGVSNTDPAVIRFFIFWAQTILGVSKNKFTVRVQLYKDMNVKKEIELWSKELRLPLSQFKKPYIKKSSSLHITYKRGFGHGTCNVFVGGTMLQNTMRMSIQCIKDFINNKKGA